MVHIKFGNLFFVILDSCIGIFRYEVLIENLMDPAHVPYAHYGIMKIPETPKR